MKFAACLIVGSVISAFWATAHSQTTPEPPPSAEQFAEGAELFAAICSHCHGPKMVNPGNYSFDLRKFHDRLLAVGGMPIDAAGKLAFGDELGN